MRQAERQQKSHDRNNERKIGEPGRVGSDEWRHSVEHQEDRERRPAMRAARPRPSLRRGTSAAGRRA
jgi:hypothetical protein